MVSLEKKEIKEVYTKRNQNNQLLALDLMKLREWGILRDQTQQPLSVVELNKKQETKLQVLERMILKQETNQLMDLEVRKD